MDGLQTAAAGLLGAPVASVAVVGGASEAWASCRVVVQRGVRWSWCPAISPSVTYPWLAARDRLGMRIRWVRDTPDRDLTQALASARPRSTVGELPP